VDDFLKGYNATVMAYGQVGAGKTFTMTGDMKVSSIWSQMLLFRNWNRAGCGSSTGIRNTLRAARGFDFSGPLKFDCSI